MYRKSFALALGILVSGTPFVRAQTSAPAAPPPAAPSLSVTATPSYVSQYMFRGQRLGGQAFQPSVEADYGSWAVGVWTSTPANKSGKVIGQSDPEVDPYGSYTYSINDSLSLQPGFTWYTYPRAKPANGFYRMTFEPNLALNWTIQGVKLTPKFYYDAVLREETYELSAGYALPLKEIGTELDLSAAAGTYSGTTTVDQAKPDVKAWGNYWLLGVSVPYQITKSTKLSVGWAYTQGDSAYTKQGSQRRMSNPAAVGRGVATVSLAWTF